MAKMVTLSIDGKQVTVLEGTLVVDAAKKAGVDIPVFCYHPKMEPVGMCRMCLVEIGRPLTDRTTGQPVLDEHNQPKIQFLPKLETACTNVVSEGMVALTQSEKAVDGQKGIVEFLLTSHPLDCPICDKGGECPLQNLTMAHGASESRFVFDEKNHADKHVALGELIYLDRERCIQCARCIRFQSDIAGEPVIGFYNRGRTTDIVTYSEPGFDSIFSGNTSDICPVGALTTADFRFGARPWEMNNAASICTQCPVGCNTTLNVRREAKSGGNWVIKRVMPRQNEQVNETWICDKGRFAGYQYAESVNRLTEARVDSKSVSFEIALKKAADKLSTAKSQAVILASGRLASEDLYNLKKLSEGLGAKPLLYTNMGGGDFVSAYGLSAGSNLGDLGAEDAIVVVASDLHNEAPLWWLRVKAAAKRGATLIVVNARETALDKYAKFAVRYAYGDEIKIVDGLAETDKIGALLKSARNLVVFFGADGLSLQGSQAVAGACAELVKSRAGKPNNGLVGVWKDVNAQGAWELGFRPSADLVADLKDKVVYIAGADPAGDNPALADALKAAAFVITQDILPSATTALSHIVLPVSAYTEREGVYVSGERRAQRFYPVVPARPGLKADFALTAEIARLAGIELEGRSALIVFNHIAAEVPAFAGLAYAKLAETTEQWPLIGRGDVYYGGTSYENKQGLGAHLTQTSGSGLVRQQIQNALRPKEDELLAVPVSKIYDMGTTMQAATLLAQRVGQSSIVINPTTAQTLGLASGDMAEVKSKGFRAWVLVALDASVSAGIVLVYRSFGIPISEPTPVTVAVAEKA